MAGTSSSSTSKALQQHDEHGDNAGHDSSDKPKRPVYGTVGNKIKLHTNYFPLEMMAGIEKLVLYRYEIRVDEIPQESDDTTPGEAAMITIPGKASTSAQTKATRQAIMTGDTATSGKATATENTRTIGKATKTTRDTAPPGKAATTGQAMTIGKTATAGNASATGEGEAPEDNAADQKDSKKSAPKGKKLARIIKLLLDLPDFQNKLDVFFTDSKALLYSSYSLGKTPRPFIVPYFAEYDTRPRSNKLQYQVSLTETGSFSLASPMGTTGGNSASNLAPAHEKDLIQALNILLLHHGRSSTTVLSVGSRRSFPANGATLELPGKLLARRGYFSSVRIADHRLLANVNVSHGTFYPECTLKQLMEYSGYLRDPHLLQAYLRGVRIKMNHLGVDNQRVKTIVGLAMPGDGKASLAKRKSDYREPIVQENGGNPCKVQFHRTQRVEHAPAQSQGLARGSTDVDSQKPIPFTFKDLGYITVSDYYKQEYSKKLIENLPVVNAGSIANPVYLPADVCNVLPDQPYQHKLNADQISKMIEFAVSNIKPQQINATIVANGFETVGLDSPQLTQLRIQSKRQLVTVDSRILDFPVIRYHKDQTADIQQRAWNMDGLQFSGPKIVPKWSYLHIQFRNARKWSHYNVKKTIGDLRERIAASGITIQEPFQPGSLQFDNAQDSNVEKELKKWLEACRSPDFEIEFLVVVLPAKDLRLYNAIKRIGDVEVGLPTVCVTIQKLCGPQPCEKERDELKRQSKLTQTYANIALKVNLKLGGRNHELEEKKLGIIDEDKTMVVGIDVTHPSPRSEKGCPSVAAMVASVDKHLAQWPASLSLQYKQDYEKLSIRDKTINPQQEMVSEVATMLQSRLEVWRSLHEQQLPENILIYRDGVSEGQYDQVLQWELAFMKAKCVKEYKKAKQALPRFTLIIVAKRHHTRFFPVNVRQQNPVAGTVVDNGICDDQAWDFFLQSHDPIQGVARPAHYIVLKNEIFTKESVEKYGPPGCNNIADVVENITYNMCWLYGRATRPVSYCPAAYFADRVCDRARCYLSKYFNRENVARGTQGVAQEGMITLPNTVKDTMFYI